MIRLVHLLFLAVLIASPALGETLRLGATTTTENSGLLAAILPQFTEDTGIEVEVIATGSGRALRLVTDGDVDAVLAHHPLFEQELVAKGSAIDRRPVMANQFVLVGPEDDPANIGDAGSLVEAFRRLGAAESRFASRGDDSGTHWAERQYWAAAGVQPNGSWYLETGAGMGATLTIAAGIGAYALSDRGTWLAYQNRDGLVLVADRGADRANRYSVLRANPDRHPHAAVQNAVALADWLTGEAGQSAIAAFRPGGTQAFCALSAARNQRTVCEKLDADLKP